MRQLVYIKFITNNHDSFHLWWKEISIKHQKVSKYCGQDCILIDILKIQIKNEQSRLCWTFAKYWQWVSSQKEILIKQDSKWKSLFIKINIVQTKVAFDQTVTAKTDNKSIVRCLVLSHGSFLSIFVLISKLYTKWNHKIIFKHKIFYHYVYSRYKKTEPS